MKLTKSQLENVLNVHRQDNKYIHADCPMCGAPEFWLIYNQDNQPCGCSRKSRCGWVGNIYTLLKKLGRSKEFYSERQIDVYEKLVSTLKFDDDEAPFPFEKLNKITAPLFWKRVYRDDYLESRGFTETEFKKHEVGISMMEPEYITFLVRQGGIINGHISRSKRPKDKCIDGHLRYKNSADNDFSKMLYGLDEITAETSDIILTEGIFSKIRTDQNLQLDSFDGMKCVCTFGAKLSDYQIALLRERNIKQLWFLFEADVLDKIKPILARAVNFFKVRASFVSGADPGDIGPEDTIALMESAKNYLDFTTDYIKSNLKIW